MFVKIPNIYLSILNGAQEGGGLSGSWIMETFSALVSKCLLNKKLMN
jgi:hypothetical protein